MTGLGREGYSCKKCLCCEMDFESSYLSLFHTAVTVHGNGTWSRERGIFRKEVTDCLGIISWLLC
jgi:hypothetical protein